MRQKDEVELARERVLKAYRTAIRLKYALLADAELNKVLPEVEEKFNKAIAQGKPFKLALKSAFEEL